MLDKYWRMFAPLKHQAKVTHKEARQDMHIELQNHGQVLVTHVFEVLLSTLFAVNVDWKKVGRIVVCLCFFLT